MPDNARIELTRIILPSELAGQIVPHMEQLGQAIGSRMQRLVPKRTWALHDTIHSETVTDNGVVRTTVGAGSDDVGYALYVERGTSRMAAQPYMRPALLQTKGADLLYSGSGITRHGVVSIQTRRQRIRQRTERGSR